MDDYDPPFSIEVEKAIKRIRHLNPKKGDVILIECDGNLPIDNLEEIFKGLDAYTHDKEILLLVTNEDMSVSFANEKLMNKHGWYRKE